MAARALRQTLPQGQLRLRLPRVRRGCSPSGRLMALWLHRTRAVRLLQPRGSPARHPRRLALPGVWGRAPPPSPPANFPGSTKPLLRAQGLPADYPRWKKLGSSAFSLLGLAIQRILPTDFILLKPCFFLFFLVFICLFDCTTFLPSYQ